jgi:hypothetical protein
MHICPDRAEPFEIEVAGERWRVRKAQWPQYGRWQIIAERLLPDGRVGGHHVLASAVDSADLDELWSAGWPMDRRQSAWPLAPALAALGAK